jgi:hypothetical protein
MKKMCIVLVLVTYSIALFSNLTHRTVNFCGPRTFKMKFVTSVDNPSLTTASIIENGLSGTHNYH